MVGAVGFDSVFIRDIKSADISKDVYRLGSKALNGSTRVHMSRSKMDRLSDAVYLEVGDGRKLKYDGFDSPRYIAAMNITYDTLFSVFDVDSRTLFAWRFFKLVSIDKELRKFIDSAKRARFHNMEARIIGMQNRQDFRYTAETLCRFVSDNGIRLSEVELFGGNARHIAIDAKLGTSFDVLGEDRVYRQGELANNSTLEQFEASLKAAGSRQSV